MKLRNKKTGEIFKVTYFNIISDYNTLAELNEEWEDYDETREQAEKAVEKLKAWKQLKDKGFQPVNCTVEKFGREILVHFIIEQPYDEKYLVLLFGGEE